jgi:hypothetical protein
MTKASSVRCQTQRTKAELLRGSSKMAPELAELSIATPISNSLLDHLEPNSKRYDGMTICWLDAAEVVYSARRSNCTDEVYP